MDTAKQLNYVPLSSSQRESLEEATTAYSASLSDDAYEYLAGRGIPPEAANTYRLGEVVEPQLGHGHVEGWLSIPYLDRNDLPVKLRFRRLHGFGEPKYLDLEGAQPRMFNVGAIHWAAHNSDVIHVAEGELDAIVLEQLGLPAVAIPGSGAWLPHHSRMLAGFNRVWVWADPDEGGRALANKICNSLRQAKVVKLEHGDVGESLQAYGPDYLYDLIGHKNEET